MAAQSKIQNSQSKIASTRSLPNSQNIAQFQLSNGVRVFVYENFASPAVIINGYLMAGELDERDPLKRGLAGFVSDCLTRGTERFSYEQIFEETESIGANLSVSSGMYTTGLFTKSLAEDMPLMLDLLSDVVRRPTFPEAEIEKERAEWLTGLQERTNSTQTMCSLAFHEMCYPEHHPFHWSSDGYPETARAITLDDLRQFHKNFFAPKEMVVVVTGAVKAEHAHDAVAAAFGDWSAVRGGERNTMPSAPAIKKSTTKKRHVKMPGKSQSNLMLGFPALPTSHPDWLTAVLMNSILGQFGMYGRLGESVRKEEGLVYYIGSRFDGGMAQGPWYLYAGTNPKTVHRVIDIAMQEVSRIQNKKVTPRELDDNKHYFTGSTPLQMETNEGIAGQIINMIRYERGLDYLLTFNDRVNAITQADVLRVAQTWLSTDKYVLATAGA
jgi:zinc protease